MPRSTIANEGGSKKVTTTTAGVKELLDIGIYDDAGALIDVATKTKQDTLITGQSNILTELQTISANTSSLAEYGIMQIDSAGSPKYYGYQSKTGTWYIMKESTTADGSAYSYTTGLSNFMTNWINRIGLTYSDYSTAF